MSTAPTYPTEALEAVDRLRILGYPVSRDYSISGDTGRGWSVTVIDEWDVYVPPEVAPGPRWEQREATYSVHPYQDGWMVWPHRWRTEEPVIVDTDDELVTFLRRQRPEDPVGATEIAERMQIDPETIKHWRRRHADFPRPRWTVGGRPAWDWSDVRAWLLRTHRPIPRT